MTSLMAKGSPKVLSNEHNVGTSTQFPAPATKESREPQPPRSTFLSIPREIRLKIYKYTNDQNPDKPRGLMEFRQHFLCHTSPVSGSHGCYHKPALFGDWPRPERLGRRYKISQSAYLYRVEEARKRAREDLRPTYLSFARAVRTPLPLVCKQVVAEYTDLCSKTWVWAVICSQNCRKAFFEVMREAEASLPPEEKKCSVWAKGRCVEFHGWKCDPVTPARD